MMKKLLFLLTGLLVVGSQCSASDDDFLDGVMPYGGSRISHTSLSWGDPLDGAWGLPGGVHDSKGAKHRLEAMLNKGAVYPVQAIDGEDPAPQTPKKLNILQRFNRWRRGGFSPPQEANAEMERLRGSRDPLWQPALIESSATSADNEEATLPEDDDDSGIFLGELGGLTISLANSSAASARTDLIEITDADWNNLDETFTGMDRSAASIQALVRGRQARKAVAKIKHSRSVQDAAARNTAKPSTSAPAGNPDVKINTGTTEVPITVPRRTPTPPGDSPGKRPVVAEPPVVGDIPPVPLSSKPGPVIAPPAGTVVDDKTKTDVPAVSEWAPTTPTIAFPATPWMPKTPAVAAPVTPAKAAGHKKTSVIDQASQRAAASNDPPEATPGQRNNLKVFGGAGLVLAGLGGLTTAGYQLRQLNTIQRKLADQNLLSSPVKEQLTRQRMMIILKALGFGIGGAAALVGGARLAQSGWAAAAA